MTVRKQPQRTCLGCRTARNQEHLLRFVLAPDGSVLADCRQKLPGRGAYVCVSRECLFKAASNGGFARSFKGAIRVEGEQLLTQVSEQLRKRIENLLGMARKAGQLIGGSNLVLGELQRRGDVALVLVANDFSAGIGGKVRAAAADTPVRTLDWLNKCQLGKLLGSAERSVVAFRSGQIVDKLLDEFSRFDQIAGDC